MEHLKKLLAWGNIKIPTTTGIFNMGEAHRCPSEALGLCKLADICYAKKAERLRPNCSPYRRRQELYWKQTDVDGFMREWVHSTERKRIRIDHLRLNESGDFWTQECVDKAEGIAEELLKRNIKTYTYTARADLDFKGLRKLKLNGSDFWKEGLNGIFVPVDEFTGTKGHLRCEGNCKKCTICSSNVEGRIIEVKKH